MACASTTEQVNSLNYPGISIDTVYQYYDITGSTSEELLQAIWRNGPEFEGQSFAGETHWETRLRFQFAFKMGECQMERVEVELLITTFLPRWKPPPDAPFTLIKQWNRGLEGLKLHEAGHRQIAMETGREIIQTLKAFRISAHSCASMESEAKKLAKDIGDKYKEKNRQYDKETRHGRTQGAGWITSKSNSKLRRLRY